NNPYYERQWLDSPLADLGRIRGTANPVKVGHRGVASVRGRRTPVRLSKKEFSPSVPEAGPGTDRGGANLANCDHHDGGGRKFCRRHMTLLLGYYRVYR